VPGLRGRSACFLYPCVWACKRVCVLCLVKVNALPVRAPFVPRYPESTCMFVMCVSTGHQVALHEKICTLCNQAPMNLVILPWPSLR